MPQKSALLEFQPIIQTADISLPVYVRRYIGFQIPKGGIDAPHRHDYQEVLWFLGGRGSHRIDGDAVDIEPGTIAVIARGQVHWFEHAEGLEFYRLCFHDDFVLGDPLQKQSLLGLFSPTRGAAPLRPSIPDRLLGLAIFEALVEAFCQVTTHRDPQVLRALIVSLVKLLERIDRETPHSSRPAHHFVQAFLQLLDQHVTQHHDVAFYSTELGVSAERLAQDLHQVLGKTTKQVIRERILLEARRFLIYTDMSIKQVAEAVGFSDPQYFGKVFKDALGITPAAYRRAAHADLSEFAVSAGPE